MTAAMPADGGWSVESQAGRPELRLVETAVEQAGDGQLDEHIILGYN